MAGLVWITFTFVHYKPHSKIKLLLWKYNHYISPFSEIHLTFIWNFSCGGGIQERTRENQLPGQCSSLKDFTCHKSTKQQRACNEQCPNGGLPNEAGCACQAGWSGTCCHTRRHNVFPHLFPALTFFTPIESLSYVSIYCVDEYVQGGVYVRGWVCSRGWVCQGGGYLPPKT